MKFNPNTDISKKTKSQIIWGTYIPDRSPKFKTYSNLAHAKSALMYRKEYSDDYEFCFIPNECTLWRLVSEGHNSEVWEEVDIVRKFKRRESLALRNPYE